MADQAEVPDREARRHAQREEAARLATEVHPDSYTGTSPVKVKKLGHLTLQVSDVERSVRFWTQVMGFEEVERNDHGEIFLRFGSDHHSIVIFKGKADRRAPASRG